MTVLPVTQPKKEERMTRRGILAAIGYMACAVALVMFNKAALSSYKFPYANVITLAQMLVSNVLLFILGSAGLISFSTDVPIKRVHPKGAFPPLKALRQALPLSAAYLMYMVVGMASIRGVSVPMYTTLRRTTVVFTMVMEYVIAGQRQSQPVVGSVGIIVVGAFVAGLRDLSFDAYGYGLVLVSNFATAVYLSTISRLGKTSGLNSFGLMWCNGIICSPFLFFWCLSTGELEGTIRFQHLLNPGFQSVIVVSCSLAFALNYTIFLNTALNSALTQTICGNLKDLGTVAIGWLLFQDLPFDVVNVIGQGLGFVGSGLYAYCKLVGIGR